MAERLRNKQITWDAEAAKLLEAEAEAEARALAEGFRNEGIAQDAEVAALQEEVQEMDEEAAQGSKGNVVKNDMPSQNSGVVPEGFRNEGISLRR